MARPRTDGTPARAVNKRKLTDLFVSTCKPGERDELIWDVKQPGLALSVRTTGKKAWKVIYRHHGRPRWLHLGDVRSIGLADARRLAAKIVLDVFEGKDPAAERKAERLTGTFADLASQYVELHAKKHNKSWKQAETLVRRHLLPRWGKLKATAITRADVRAVMVRIEAPDRRQPDARGGVGDLHLGGQAGDRHRQSVSLASTAIRPRSRERVLSDAEIKLLWREARPGAEADPADRPAARRGRRHAAPTHIVDGWWQMPGKPVGDWPGTKNGRDHRVALSEPALELIELHLADEEQRQQIGHVC